MRRALHFLVIVTVLMCGLHLGETAQAHADIDQHQVFSDADAPSGEDEDSDRGLAKAAHASHHHCPVAADLKAASGSQERMPSDAILFTRPAAALHSLSQAPPLEPPVA